MPKVKSHCYKSAHVKVRTYLVKDITDKIKTKALQHVSGSSDQYRLVKACDCNPLDPEDYLEIFGRDQAYRSTTLRDVFIPDAECYKYVKGRELCRVFPTKGGINIPPAMAIPGLERVNRAPAHFTIHDNDVPEKRTSVAFVDYVNDLDARNKPQ